MPLAAMQLLGQFPSDKSGSPDSGIWLMNCRSRALTSCWFFSLSLPLFSSSHNCGPTNSAKVWAKASRLDNVGGWS